MEFDAAGVWYALSAEDGALVRNGTRGTWTLIAPDELRLDSLFTNAPFITDAPRTMNIGIDPRFPRYVALE